MDTRGRHETKWALVTLAVGVVMALAFIPQPLDAATDQTIAQWDMNEPSGNGTRALVDGSGNSQHGTIGSSVLSGVEYAGATGHKFTWVLPNQAPADPSRLDQVPSSTGLNPGTRDYAVIFRYRSTQNFGNVVQKGQAGSVNTGGYWKFEQPLGFMTCLFRDASTSAAVKSPISTNDGQWHVIRCEREAHRLTLTIDGVVVSQRNAQPHNISNTRPITIGGKLNCDQIRITCDYFVGELDYVRIESS